MRKIKIFGLMMLLIFMLTGCRKPYDKPEFITIADRISYPSCWRYYQSRCIRV